MAVTGSSPATEDELGPIDVLVNNAAANGYRPFTEWTDRQLDIAHQVNVRAPWRLMADVGAVDAVPRGRRHRQHHELRGRTAARPAVPDQRCRASAGSGYGVSKAALNRLTVSVAAELYGAGIAVNALAPQSAIATPHLRGTR